jgi:cytoskeletal protein RodZ
MESIGPYLRRIREQRGMSLERLARETRIPIWSLESLESSRFQELPAEVFVRGFLKAYARAVSIPVDDVMARYTLSRRTAGVSSWPANLPSRVPPKRSQVRVAVGFLALLIFVAIALSWALEPSERFIEWQSVGLEGRAY